MATGQGDGVDQEGRARRRDRRPLVAFIRRHWRTTIFLFIALWLTVAIAVVFVRGFPNAERSGTAEERAAQYQKFLGTGWFPLQIAPLSTAPGWLGLNYSSGTVSTIRPAPSWTRLRLRLAPIGCAHGQPFSIAVRQGRHVLETLAPAAGWSWFMITLFKRAEPVTLQYSCVTVQLAPVGPGHAQLAVLLSGVSG